MKHKRRSHGRVPASAYEAQFTCRCGHTRFDHADSDDGKQPCARCECRHYHQ